MTAAQPAKPEPTVMKDISWVASHRKAITAYAGLILSAAALAFPHDRWLTTVIAAATALGVHLIPNAKA